MASGFRWRLSQTHAAGAGCLAAARLVRGQQDLRPLQGDDPDVLPDVVVIAGQHGDAATEGRVEHRELRAAGQVLVDEGVDLPVPPELAVGHRHDVGVVHLLAVDLDEARADHHAVLPGQAHEGLGGRSLEDRLRHRLQLFARQVPQEPVACDATFREYDQLGPLGRRMFDEALDLGKVCLLVSGGGLDLNRCHADLSHNHNLHDESGAGAPGTLVLRVPNAMRAWYILTPPLSFPRTRESTHPSDGPPPARG